MCCLLFLLGILSLPFNAGSAFALPKQQNFGLMGVELGYTEYLYAIFPESQSNCGFWILD
jgi:hypothetical protein